MPSCIFCKIYAGEIKVQKVFDDAESCAFLDLYPLARGHTLVIPKRHVALLEELAPHEVERLFLAVHKLIKIVKTAVQAPATTIAINNGSESGQEVQHVHVHIIPRSRRDRGGPIHSIMRERPSVAPLEMEEIASRIRKLSESSD